MHICISIFGASNGFVHLEIKAGLTNQTSCRATRCYLAFDF